MEGDGGLGAAQATPLSPNPPEGGPCRPHSSWHPKIPSSVSIPAQRSRSVLGEPLGASVSPQCHLCVPTAPPPCPHSATSIRPVPFFHRLSHRRVPKSGSELREGKGASRPSGGWEHRPWWGPHPKSPVPDLGGRCRGSCALCRAGGRCRSCVPVSPGAPWGQPPALARLLGAGSRGCRVSRWCRRRGGGRGSRRAEDGGDRSGVTSGGD